MPFSRLWQLFQPSLVGLEACGPFSCCRPVRLLTARAGLIDVTMATINACDVGVRDELLVRVGAPGGARRAAGGGGDAPAPAERRAGRRRRSVRRL